MIFIVTGRHRTGTSMMMRAIASSSLLSPVIDKDLEDQVRISNLSNEDANPNGFFTPHYEILPQDCKNNDLLKVTVHRWAYKLFEPVLLKNEEFRVVQIVRDERERLTSWRKHFDPEPKDKLVSLYEEGEKTLTKIARVTLDYADVIADPIKQFQKLKAAGWPIDPEKAAKYVDPKLYRNKLAKRT